MRSGRLPLKASPSEDESAADGSDTTPTANADVEPISATTFVFGAQGELQRDMALLGTSPRRVALFGGIGLSVALAGDLFGLTTTLLEVPALGDAARRSRLDTYYAVSGFRRYIDDEFGFELRYPAEWLGDQSVYMARAERSAGVVDGDADAILKAQASRRRGPRPSAIAAFGPPRGTSRENLSVFRSTIGRDFSLRGTLGEPSTAAQRLLDTAVAPPSSGKNATLLAAEELESGMYEFEYTLALPKGGVVLHNLALVAERGGELFTYTVLCLEEDWPAREQVFREIARSFRLTR